MAVSAKRFVLLLGAAAAVGSGGCLVEEDGSGSTDARSSNAKADADAGAKSNGPAPTGTTSVETAEFLRMAALFALLATVCWLWASTFPLQLPLVGALPVPGGVFAVSLALSVAGIYLLAILCGWYPARLAVRVEPTEALRYE